VIALLVTLFGSSVAAAFTAAPGFSATTYASGFVSGTPAGIVFFGGSLYAVDPSDGWLYRGTGVAPLTMARLGTAPLGNAPTGIAELGGLLYVTRSNSVVRVDPATGAITGTVATATDIPCPRAIAAGPVTDPALYVSSCQGIWRIASPAVAPVITKYAEPPLSGGAYGITVVTSDDMIYVAVPDRDQVWSIQGPIPAGGGLPAKTVVATTPMPRGIAVISNFLFVNHADGSITKHPLSGEPAIVALTGGDPGDLATTGPDGCFYASQGAAVIRLANANGTCDLAAAAPPPPPPSLVLDNISSTSPLIGGADQILTATLQNVANTTGIVVTFTVTGANPTTKSFVVLSPATRVEFRYTASNLGTDTVVARTIVNGTSLTSNPVSITWLQMISADATTPAGHYTYGTATSSDVTLTFTCAAPSGVRSCPNPVVVSGVGTHFVTVTAEDKQGNVVTQTFGPIVIVPATQSSTLIITSPLFIASGGTVSATLVGANGLPVPNRTITFSTGATIVTATTNASGVATATLALAPGQYTLTAMFAGDAAFLLSNATQTLTVAQVTQFVIWGGNTGGLHPGERVQFWGAQWAKQVKAGDYQAGGEFKGWAQTVAGATWSSKGGDSKPPDTVASFISVIVTTHVARSGDVVAGNVARIAILRVESPETYDGNVGHPGFGTVVALL
jgi:hypothetical protein